MGQPVTLPSPAVTPPLSPFFCLTGVVEPIITAPPPFRGDITAVLITPQGGRVPLIQTRPSPFALPLGEVAGRFSIVCGVLRQVGNRIAFGVLFTQPLLPARGPLPGAALPPLA